MNNVIGLILCLLLIRYRHSMEDRLYFLIRRSACKYGTILTFLCEAIIQWNFANVRE